jgi:hypothetical protein
MWYTVCDGPVRQPYASADFIPQSGIMNLAAGQQGLTNDYI